jgi:starch phosphorylase
VAVELDTKGLNDKGIGVELVAIRTSTHNNDKLYEVKQLNLVKAEGSHLFFEVDYRLDYAGGMKFGLRMYPKHDLLPHRMDFCYVRWI